MIPHIPVINLLHERKRRLAAATAVFGRLKRAAVVVLVVYGVVLAGVLGFGLYLQNQQAALKADIRQAQAAVAALKANEEQFTLMKNKVGLVGVILKDQEKRRQALQFVYDLGSDGVEINNVSLGEQKTSVVATVEVRNVFTLQSFLSAASNAVSAGQFRGVSIADLRRNDDGTYKFKCTFPLVASTPAKKEKT